MKANVIVVADNGTKSIPIDLIHALWIEFVDDDSRSNIRVGVQDGSLEISAVERISIEPRAANSVWVKVIK